MIQEVKTSIIYEYLQDSDKRITVFQGGSRSSKTYNTLIWLIVRLMQEQKKVLTICRKTFPALKGTAMRDFFEIIQNMGLYSEAHHNKTENSYTLNNNLVEFLSLDDSQKIRGRKRDYLFINEANEVTYKAFTQLLLRTAGKVIIDYNPSDEFSYIYDRVITRDDCDFYKTTYKDNPFLDQNIIDEIERLQFVDETLWRVFGLGERGTSKANIFTHYKEIDQMPILSDWSYGLDFGYNDPLAFVQVAYKDGALYWDETVYETRLTNSDFIERMQNLGVLKSKAIYADDANPREIQDIYRAGYNIKAAKKGTINIGINKIKSTPLYITSSSINLLKEIRSYKWKEDKEGIILDEPVDYNNHLLDAARYASINYLLTSITEPRSQLLGYSRK